MPSSTRVPSPPAPGLVEQLRPGFAALAGLFLGIALLKFGNPALLDHLVVPPTNYWEYVIQPWPLAWGYLALGLLTLAGLAVARWRLPQPRWLVLLPVAWLAWQCLAALTTRDPKLTSLTLPYLATTTLGFYLGLFALAPSPRLTIYWAALLGCFIAVLISGFQQRFGGLEAVRQAVYAQPDWQRLPADYLNRLAANRIFATLFYPNALAGAVLLFLPPLTVALWRLTDQSEARLRLGRYMNLGAIGRGSGRAADPSTMVRLGRSLALPDSWSMRMALGPIVLSTLLALAGLACLYWSKSKAGWLIAIVLDGVCALRLPLARRLKVALVVIGCIAALGGFAWRFSGYFERGATSAGARLEYWRAAWTIATAHPLLGTGPGTFGAGYRALKPPDAEMALLAHNDYLQQASDSGFPGALLFLTFVAGSLTVLWRRVQADPLHFAIWLGLLGWALQSSVEFSLYVPAIGWGAFWLLGYLWGATAAPGESRR